MFFINLFSGHFACHFRATRVLKEAGTEGTTA